MSPYLLLLKVIWISSWLCNYFLFWFSQLLTLVYRNYGTIKNTHLRLVNSNWCWMRQVISLWSKFISRPILKTSWLIGVFELMLFCNQENFGSWLTNLFESKQTILIDFTNETKKEKYDKTRFFPNMQWVVEEDFYSE